MQEEEQPNPLKSSRKWEERRELSALGEATAPWVRPDEGVGEKARGAALKLRTETAPAHSSRCYARPREEAFAPEDHSRSVRLHRLATVMSVSADGTRDSI